MLCQPGAPASPPGRLSLWQRLPTHQDLGGVGAVDGDGMDQQLHGLGVDGAGVGDLLVVDIAHIGLHHRHAIGGQGARLVRADGCGIAHGLAGIQVADQVVVLHHFLQEGAGERAQRGQGAEAGGEGTAQQAVNEAELPLCFTPVQRIWAPRASVVGVLYRVQHSLFLLLNYLSHSRVD